MFNIEDRGHSGAANQQERPRVGSLSPSPCHWKHEASVALPPISPAVAWNKVARRHLFCRLVLWDTVRAGLAAVIAVTALKVCVSACGTEHARGTESVRLATAGLPAPGQAAREHGQRARGPLHLLPAHSGGGGWRRRAGTLTPLSPGCACAVHAVEGPWRDTLLRPAAAAAAARPALGAQIQIPPPPP